MSDSRRLAAAAVALVVAALALWLRFETAQHQITGAASSCAISGTFDCDAVQASEYAKVMGISLSTWGAAGSLILLGWLLASKRKGDTLLVAAGALAAFNLLVALYTLYVSSFELGTFCLYCTGMQLGIVALAILVLPPAFRTLRAERWRLEPRALAFGGFLAAGLLVLAFAGEGFAGQRTHLLRAYSIPKGKAMRLDIAGSLTLGDPKTPNTVVSFVCFGCPNCAKLFNIARDLVRKYPDDVHFRFKHFPLDRECNPSLDATSHPNACMAAAAGQAAHSLGKDEEAAAYLFKNQRKGFTRRVLNELGREIGAVHAEWKRLRESDEVQALVQRDIRDGNQLGLTGVPTIYVNGRYVPGDRLPVTVERLCGR